MCRWRWTQAPCHVTTVSNEELPLNVHLDHVWWFSRSCRTGRGSTTSTFHPIYSPSVSSVLCWGFPKAIGCGKHWECKCGPYIGNGNMENVLRLTLFHKDGSQCSMNSTLGRVVSEREETWPVNAYTYTVLTHEVVMSMFCCHCMSLVIFNYSAVLCIIVCRDLCLKLCCNML